MVHDNLLGGPPETLLASDPAAEPLDGGADPVAVVRSNPTSSLGWAVLAERALEAGHDVEAYAYARTGYHRGLDALRRNGWKGYGPVPWSHEPNRGFLRCLTALARAAEAIEETDEQERCTALLRDCDPSLAP
jgi:Protein of unknown function (DUF3151)